MIAVTAYRLPSSRCETELIEMIFRRGLLLEREEWNGSLHQNNAGRRVERANGLGSWSEGQKEMFARG